MDTSELEKSVENLISHRLEKLGFLVAKPDFDKNGTDLLACLSMEDGGAGAIFKVIYLQENEGLIYGHELRKVFDLKLRKAREQILRKFDAQPRIPVESL